MRNKHFRTWIVVRKQQKLENETQKLYELEMARNTEKRNKRETHLVGLGKWRETVKNVKNEKCTLQDQDCGEKTEKHGKCYTHTVGPGIWQEN